MTPTDVIETKALICRLWPRVGGGKGAWSEEEWSVLVERAGALPIEREQAAAALRNHKATSDKYPNVAAVLRALSAAAPRVHTFTGEDDRPTYETPLARGDVLGHYRQHLRMGPDAPPSWVVQQWHHALCRSSVALRGYAPPGWIDRARAELVTLGGMSGAEADEWSVAFANYYPSEPPATPTPLQAWYADFTMRTGGKIDVAHFERALAREHDGRARREDGAVGVSEPRGGRGGLTREFAP